MAIIDPARLKQKNMGRVQATVVGEEVRSLLAQGFSRRAIYDELHEKGAFSGSYRRFCEYFRQQPVVVPHREPEQAPQPVPAVPQATPGSGFIHRKYSDNELI
jgi:hypothetical protein